jgi:hypothetical protein
MWVGTFDFEAMEFTSEGTVYHFPRDNECEVGGLAVSPASVAILAACFSSSTA